MITIVCVDFKTIAFYDVIAKQSHLILVKGGVYKVGTGDSQMLKCNENREEIVDAIKSSDRAVN